MRILITGAGGMLGLDVAAAAQAAGHEPIGLSRAQLDIADAGAVAAAIASHRPQAVINCAAYTKVDAAESDEATALTVNGDGAGVVAAAAAASGAWTVHVSTDYVFAGDADPTGDGYVESDPVAPRSAYGRTKLAGERAVAAAAPDAHTIVRSSWLFGVGGPCFPKTMLRLAAERDALNVVADQIGCPTFTGHLAPALVQLAVTRAAAGITHVAAAGRCSWWEFARETIDRAGAACAVSPITTAEYPVPAPRPAFSVLVSERAAEVPRLPDWQQGLTEFMAAMEVRT